VCVIRGGWKRRRRQRGRVGQRVGVDGAGKKKNPPHTHPTCPSVNRKTKQDQVEHMKQQQ